MAWAGAGTALDPYCLTCDGVDDVVDLGNLGAFDLAASAFTAEVWVKTTSTTAFVGLFDKIKSSVGWSVDWGSGGAVGKPRLNINGSSVSSSTAINDGNWHHVVATYDGSSNVQVIVDNGTPTTASGVNPGGVANEPLYLMGALPSSNYLPGSVAQARIYNRVLSGSEITSLYGYGVDGSGAGSVPVTSGLLVNLEAKYANGGTTNYAAAATTSPWADKSGNSRPGRLVNFEAPGDPTALSVVSDAYARAVGTFTPDPSGGWPSGCKVFRSQASGGTYVEVTSNCVITPTGFVDKRPSYGSQPIAHGQVGYYKVKAVNAVGDSTGYSSVGSGTIDVDQGAVELTQWQKLVAYEEANSSNFQTNAGYLGGAYPGAWLLAPAYIALTQPAERATALTKLDDWFTYIVTNHVDAHDIFQRPGGSYTYRDDHFRLVFHLMLCYRLLVQITGDATATALGATILAQTQAMAAAAIDLLGVGSYGAVKGFGGDFPKPASATAWAATTVYVVSSIRRPTVANGRIYRVIVPGTSGGSQPTWPTTDRGIVQDGTVYWQECTNDVIEWAAATAYEVGDIRLPTTRNNRTYICTVAGTSHASVEPTWPTSDGGTVTDGTVTWKETSRSGNVFSATYSTAYPYTGGGTYSTDLNQVSEIAAALALLVKDPDATDFYTGGSYNATANTLITAHAGKCSAVIAPFGGVPVGDIFVGEQRYDTLYGSFVMHTMAVTVHEMGGAAWDPQVWAFVNNGLDWLDANFQTEPTIGNDVTGGHEAYASGPLNLDELAWRNAAYQITERSNATGKLVYDSSTHPSSLYVQAGQAPSVESEDNELWQSVGVWAGVIGAPDRTPTSSRIRRTLLGVG